MRRRTSSTNVGLSAAFVALAMGGTAACDSQPDVVEEEHRFYCTAEDGTIVPEDYCDEDGDGRGGGFFIFHSTSYPHGLQPGTKIPAGGQGFKYNDSAARTTWGLPASGKIGNGSTVKVGVAGKGGAPVSKGG